MGSFSLLGAASHFAYLGMQAPRVDLACSLHTSLAVLTLTTARLALALATGPAPEGVDTDWYAERACVAFPDDLCSDWRVLSVEACDDDGETACVILTHPTAWGNAPHTFLGVYDSADLAIMAVRIDGEFTRIFD